jgi:hypothetical protein
MPRAHDEVGHIGSAKRTYAFNSIPRFRSMQPLLAVVATVC